MNISEKKNCENPSILICSLISTHFFCFIKLKEYNKITGKKFALASFFCHNDFCKNWMVRNDVNRFVFLTVKRDRKLYEDKRKGRRK